jgi:hypothetical protein
MSTVQQLFLTRCNVVQNDSAGLTRQRSIKRGSWFNPETLANQKVLSIAFAVLPCRALLYCLTRRHRRCHHALPDVQREWGQQFKDKSKVVDWPEHNFEHFIVVVRSNPVAE